MPFNSNWIKYLCETKVVPENNPKKIKERNKSWIFFIASLISVTIKMIALKTILTSSTRQTHAFSFKGLTNTLGLFHRHNSNFCTNQNNKKIFLTPDTHVKHVSRAVRLFSKISSENEPSEKKEPNKPKSKKIKLNPNWKEEYDSDSLIAAFEKMAKRDGFDESTAIYADHDTFEDDFEDDDYDDLGFGNDDTGEGGGESMADRIAAAKRDDDFGSSSKRSKQNDEKMKRKQLKEYGYRWGDRDFYGPDDETSRKEDMEELFSLVTDARTCPACGTDFQCKDEEKPGFLPPEKYDIQMKLSKIEEMQKLQEKADSAEWSPEDEIEWLLQTSTNNEDELEEVGDPHSSSGINIRAVAEQLDLDIDSLSKKKIICKRCHRLQNFGEVEKTLRPGYTEEPLLSQEAFRQLLLPLREKQSVIIALVDLFDFSGSVLPELDAIAGDNPVILAANKADLLPSKMGQTRAENWVRRELEYMGVQSIANIGGAVRSISCKTGFGVSSMLDKARQLADEMDCDIYVVGAANAGKSTLINHILEKNEERILASRRGRGLDLPKKRAGNKNSKKGQITTSPLPGTTLKFIKVDLGGKEVKRSLYDTPGLLVPGTLTQLLTPAELKMVVPKK